MPLTQFQQPGNQYYHGETGHQRRAVEGDSATGMEVDPTGCLNGSGKRAQGQNIQRSGHGAFWQMMGKEREAEQHRVE